MKKSILFFVFFEFLCIPFVKGEGPFGYISNSTLNIGDDIQTIAAKRFLPENSISIDREFISEFNYGSTIKTVVSGWFMHHSKDVYWDLQVPPPQKCWPPSPVIDPFFISFHITGSIQPIIFSDENIEYLKIHGPIGARDLFTLHALQKRDVPCYFSGCLTLTLENTCEERGDTIYLVDLHEDAIKYIRSKVKSPIVVLTHSRPFLQFLTQERRLKYTEHLLDLYRKAKCVVTTRLHAAMPCLAFKTPVFVIPSDTKGSINLRFTGLEELTWHCSTEELCNGEIDYDFDNPPKNPETYIPMRENLIQRMTEWVNKNSQSTEKMLEINGDDS